MESISQKLAKRGVATLRYQFSYMEQGGKRPDARPLLLATVRSAVEAARALDASMPLFAGGKSMGGRMASLTAAEEPLSGVKGIIFLGFLFIPPDRRPRKEHITSRLLMFRCFFCKEPATNLLT
jgi:hypothetical protein